jgi:hypothetical protein
MLVPSSCSYTVGEWATGVEGGGMGVGCEGGIWCCRE